MVDRKGFEPLTSPMPWAHPTRLNDRPISNIKNETDFVKVYQHLSEFILLALGETYFNETY